MDMDDFEALTMVKYDVARDVFAAQDDKTQKALQKLADEIEKQTTGSVKIGRKFVQAGTLLIQYSAFTLAIEIAKDLAVCGVRVANFVLPADLCFVCGDSV